MCISKDAFSKPEPYGIMLRKDDPAFKKVVDAATAALYTGGEGQKMYDKWFMQKIPPKGPQSQRSDQLRAEERVCEAVRFAGSGFVQVNVPALMQWPGHCMSVLLWDEWRTVGTREL